MSSSEGKSKVVSIESILGITREAAAGLVGECVDVLLDGGVISIRGVGRIGIERMAPRRGYSFSLGKVVEYPESYRVVFKSSGVLKGRIREEYRIAGAGVDVDSVGSVGSVGSVEESVGVVGSSIEEDIELSDLLDKDRVLGEVSVDIEAAAAVWNAVVE